MHSVFPETSGCVQKPEDLAFAKKVGTVDYRFGIGYGNRIDAAAATKQGVTVSYTPGYGATAVAEYALGFMLASTRHISKEGGENMLRIAYANLDAFLKGEKLHVVNAA